MISFIGVGLCFIQVRLIYIKINNMKIEYTLKEVKPNIFAVIVPNDYDRAMLFCRVQEFYESDSDLFKDQDFDMWEYMRWYSEKNKGVFTYTKDWSGFNIPFKVALNCVIGTEEESPYDKIMQDILDQILLTDNHADAYIIGTKSDKGLTFRHEMAHALYYTNKDYKYIADKLTSTIPLKYYNIMVINLLNLGYDKSVIDDEIQAYMSTNYNAKYFNNGIEIQDLNELHEKYKQELNYFLK